MYCLLHIKNWLDSQPSFCLIRWLFLRGLALVYGVAFLSMSGQIAGLIGAKGILPVTSLLEHVGQYYQTRRLLILPTVFWINSSDQMLISVCMAGVIAAILLLFGVFQRLMLLICFTLYLSIASAGQDFTSFQWDALLLEAGFLALFLSWGSPILLWLYRFLIMRFMLMSGVVKIASGDPAWRELTALNYHYQTQPLPSPLAYYANLLPEWLNTVCVGYVLAVELVLPFFVLMPRRFRVYAAWNFIILETGILLTGNYNFFNLITILLCIFLFEDCQVEQLIPRQIALLCKRKERQCGIVAHGVVAGWATVVFLVCGAHLWLYHDRQTAKATPLNYLVQITSDFWLVNKYGPFAVITKDRPEIIIQGSSDGVNWRDYQFKYKPDKPDKKLSWNIPHQPRLDWQLWFAAMQQPDQIPWFVQFMRRLREGSPPVLELLAVNPFPDNPPYYIRALLFNYRFTTPEQRVVTGTIWQRELIRQYWPP